MTSAAAIASRRLHQQRIDHDGLRRPSDVVGWLGAMQAQEYDAAKWAIGLRLAGDAVEAEVERAFETGRILRTHVLRPTWHFVTPSDIRWLLALTGPRVQRVIAVYTRRLELDARTLSRGIDVIGRRLRDYRHLTRKALADALRDAGVPLSGQRLALLLMHAELEAIVCSGPRQGRRHTYALLADRAPRAVTMSRDEALARLSHRFFRSHGPATARDFSWWSGLTIADAKRGVAMNRARANEIDGLTYWTIGQPALDHINVKTREPESRRTLVRLLPIYDEYLIAYRDRAAVPHVPSGSVMAGVTFQHPIVIQGQVAGTWRTARTRDIVQLRAAPCRSLSHAERRGLAKAARHYGQFLGTPIEIVSQL